MKTRAEIAKERFGENWQQTLYGLNPPPVLPAGQTPLQVGTAIRDFLTTLGTYRNQGLPDQPTMNEPYPIDINYIGSILYGRVQGGLKIEAFFEPASQKFYVKETDYLGDAGHPSWFGPFGPVAL